MGSTVGVLEGDASGVGVTVGEICSDMSAVLVGSGVGVIITVTGEPMLVTQASSITATKAITLVKTNHNSTRIHRFISTNTLQRLSMKRMIPR